MKIMFITNCFAPNEIGGAEVTMNTVREQFVKEGYDTQVLTLSTNKTKQSLDPAVVQIPLANIYDPWRDVNKKIFSKILWKLIDFFNPIMGFRTWLAIRKFDPDCIYTHNLKGFSVSVWFVVWLSRAKTRHVFHDYYLICSRCSLEVKGKRCEKACISCHAYSFPKKVLARFCIDRFIGVSGFIANKHKEVLGIPDFKIRVINNARPADSQGQFSKLSAAGGQLGLPRKRNHLFTFGFIGRAEPVKGLEFLFSALAQVDIDYVLLIAGRECYPGYIDHISRVYPNVTFKYLGFVNSKDFYRQVDCVVVPSLWDEPLGGVTYESMEFGVPVIGSRIGGIPEVVLDNINGLLVEPNDSADLAKKLALIVSDLELYNKLSIGTKSAEHLFDPMRLKTQYFEDVTF